MTQTPTIPTLSPNPFKNISAQKSLQQTRNSKATRPILQGQNPPRLVIGDSLLVIGNCLDIYQLPFTKRKNLL
jgi:hypothetical protein